MSVSTKRQLEAANCSGVVLKFVATVTNVSPSSIMIGTQPEGGGQFVGGRTEGVLVDCTSEVTEVGSEDGVGDIPLSVFVGRGDVVNNNTSVIVGEEVICSTKAN